MSSVPRVPERGEPQRGALTGRQAWGVVQRERWSLVRDAFVRFRFGDGFTSSRALSAQLALAGVPLVLAAVAASVVLEAEGAGLVLRRTLLWLTPGASDPVVAQVLQPPPDDREDRAEAALGLGLPVALVALATAMGQIERGANRIYGIQRDRPSVRKYARASLLALVAGLPGTVGIVLVIGSTALGRAVQEVYGLPSEIVIALGWPAGAVLVLVAITITLVLAPYRRQPRWPCLAAGAALSLVLALLFTALLGVYLTSSGHLTGLYGPLLGGMALLLWSQTTSIAIFLGVALCAQLEASSVSVPPVLEEEEEELGPGGAEDEGGGVRTVTAGERQGGAR